MVKIVHSKSTFVNVKTFSSDLGRKFTSKSNFNHRVSDSEELDYL